MTVETIAQRIRTQLEELSAFTATPGNGVTRFPFTQEARKASDYLKTRMEEVGLSADGQFRLSYWPTGRPST